MDDEKLDKNGLIRVWLKIWTLLKLLVGDVDVVGKGDLQTQINNMDRKVTDCFQSASDGKKLVADAITGKGVTTLGSDTFATMAANIAKIKAAASLQSKSVALNTSTTSVTLKPDNGYDGLSQATASITLQEKTVALSTLAQNITPDSGKVLSKVAIPAVSGTAVAKDVLTGKTFSSAVGIDETGSMPELADVTVEATSTTQDDNYTYLGLPAGHYSEDSKVRTKNSNLGNQQKIIKQIYAITDGQIYIYADFQCDYVKATSNTVPNSFGSAYTTTLESLTGGGTITVTTNPTKLPQKGLYRYRCCKGNLGQLLNCTDVIPCSANG